MKMQNASSQQSEIKITMIKKLKLFAALAGITILITACGDRHFLNESAYRNSVRRDLAKKEKALGEGNLFAILHTDTLTTEEQEALEFLYAYMTLSDIADYDGSYYLGQVRAAFKARREMPWGKQVPEREFRHFVLPVRVNNENLDTSRTIFYAELKDRVKGMSMKQAILEVNHWCHEKASYAPSSARTRSPLSTVLNAIGRCGEESTFTVAALRAVGIPARQVYTPRWAHTDDNHAWVEAWADGKWHFLGACEPAPDLDDAWFNSSVVRAMLCHTRVFGRYDGPEEVMERTENFTKINVIDNYTPTDVIEVKVCDAAGNVVKGAEINFCIYNYGEFASVTKKISDKYGKSSLHTGRGDMPVWVNKDGLFGFAVSKADDRKEVVITLKPFSELPAEITMKIVPPTGKPLPTHATEAEINECNQRLAGEDSIRSVYESSFLNHSAACLAAEELGVDTSLLAPILIRSRGNHAAITGFLASVPTSHRKRALDLLSVLSEKDYTDTPLSTLKGIFASTPPGKYDDFDLKYILSPLAEQERITNYRPTLSTILSPAEKTEFKDNPEKLLAWVMQNIRLDSEYNTLGLAISPTGVWRAKCADLRSAGLFFIAMARTIGIPTRVDKTTSAVQYSSNRGTDWHNVDFRTMACGIEPTGILNLAYTATKEVPDPAYYRRFTLAKLLPSGYISTIAYDEEGDTDYNMLFAKPCSLTAGNYLLFGGTRMASGSILLRISPFVIEQNKVTRTHLKLLSDPTDVQVIGSLDAEQTYFDLKDKEQKTILSTTGRGYFAIAILGAGEEPTNHALKDIELVADKLDKWGGKILMLFPNEDVHKRYKAADFPRLPASVAFGIDKENKVARMLASGANLPSPGHLPIVVIADSFGRIVFVRQGYTIGIGEEMIQTIRKL